VKKTFNFLLCLFVKDGQNNREAKANKKIERPPGVVSEEAEEPAIIRKRERRNLNLSSSEQHG